MVFKKTKSKIGNILTYGLSFFASAFGILLNFVLARFLEAEQYGKLQFFVALSTTISQFLIVGLNSFLIREAKNEKHNGEIFNKCASIFFVIVIFFVPIIYFVLRTRFLDGFSNPNSIIIILGVAILIGLMSLIAAYFQGSGKYNISIIWRICFIKFYFN